MKGKHNFTRFFAAFFVFFNALFVHNDLSAQSCPGLGGITLNVILPPPPSLTAPAQICPGSSGKVSVNESFSNYLWSTGSSSNNITITTPGTFTVTVTHAVGCTSSETITVDPATAPSTTITQGIYDCSEKIVLDAGNGFNTYAWSGNGGNNQTATFNSTGTYTVTVTNTAGCTSTASAMVNIPAAPVVTISGNLNICSGQSTTLYATSGFNTYAWSEGGSTSALHSPTGGIYTVTVTNSVGCTAIETAEVTVNPAPVPQLSSPQICSGTIDTLFVTNGPFTSYTWSGSTDITSYLIAAPGNYTVTVTTAAGCTGANNGTINPATAPSPVITSPAYSCNGMQTLDAGAGFNSYLWSGNQTTSVISVNTSGMFTVTVTGSTGCTGISSINITIPPAPQVAISGLNSFCQNTTSELSATIGFTDYKWSNSETTSAISVYQSGSFTVTVTDSFGCATSATIDVIAHPLPLPVIAGPEYLCDGNTATFTLGQTFATYLWSNSGTSSTISANATGTYSVTVSDATGCTGADEISLVINPNPAPVITEEPYACDEQIILKASPGFNAYHWNNNASTASTNLTQSGTYTVTVTDINGCTGVTSQNITVPIFAQVSINGPEKFCTGTSITLSAGPGFAVYSWNTNANQSDLSTPAAGTYTVTATDIWGCTSIDSTTVSLYPQTTPVISGPQTVCPGNTATLSIGGNFPGYLWSNGSNAASITVQPPFSGAVTVIDSNGCTGMVSASVAVSNQLTPSIVQQPYTCNGLITLDAGAGFPIYQWNVPGSTSAINVSQSGTYTVTVSDGAGCSGTAVAQVTVPAPLQVSIAGDQLLCPTEISTLTASVGFTSYLWSNGNNSNTTEVNTVGNYTVTVTDALGCTNSATITLTAQVPPAPVITGAATICGSGPVDLSVSGTFSSFLWSTSAVLPGISVTAPGTYAVTVTDANGCTGSAQQTLVANGSIPADITLQPYACDGHLTLDAGTGNTIYIWSNGLSSQTIQVNQSGTYTVTVSNSAGCTGSATVQASIPSAPMTGITGATTFCAGNSTILTASAGFGNYTWSNGTSQPALSATLPGIYTVTVTDTNGCTATASATVQVTILSPDIQNNEIVCEGSTLTISVTGTYAEYLWSDGSKLDALTVTTPGVYTVTVTDASGCTGSAASNILAVPPASVLLTVNGVLCGGNNVALTATGSIGEYIWSGGTTGASIQVTQSGTYTVTVTDPNGCTATDIINVQAGDPAATTITRQTCRQQQTGTSVTIFTAVNGCDSVVTTITVFQLTMPGLQIDLGPTLEIKSGQEISLGLAANFPVDSIVYQSPFTLSCSNCLAPNFTATESGIISVTAYNADGCPVSDELTIVVSKKPDIFVPNSFQPGDKDNGYFSVFSGPGISFISNFKVFDRWGEALFIRDKIPTNDPWSGWDGTYRNKAMPPGVYVYYFEVNLTDGSKVIYKGDVTIVR